MMTDMKRYGIAFVFLCGLWGLQGPAAVGGPGPVTSPIDRTAGPIRLGMAVEEFQRAVQSVEQTGQNPGLIQDERSFEVVRESLSNEIRGMGCRFLRGRLYRITVEYREGAFDENRWDALVAKNRERYGKALIRKQSLGSRPVEFIQWDDPQTRLLLQREHRMRFESKQAVKQYGVLMILLDQALWNERQEAEGSLF